MKIMSETGGAYTSSYTRKPEKTENLEAGITGESDTRMIYDPYWI